MMTNDIFYLSLYYMVHLSGGLYDNVISFTNTTFNRSVNMRANSEMNLKQRTIEFNYKRYINPKTSEK